MRGRLPLLRRPRRGLPAARRSIAESAGAATRCMFQPLGAVLAVMPWNFPFWQVIRFAAPALAAGNVGLLKHASNVPQCALALEDLFARAGAPDGRVPDAAGRVRPGGGDHRRRPRRGRDRDRQRGRRARHRGDGRQALKKSVLELGGSDAFIVLPSADLPRAVATAVKARIVNNGQSCIAAKRFIVADASTTASCASSRRRWRRCGSAIRRRPTPSSGRWRWRRSATASPIRSTRSVAAGARLLTGGRRLDGPGYFYPPTVLADVPPDAPAAREEVFGPVAAVFRVAGIDEAIALANASPFGLGAAAWTRDRARGRAAGARAGGRAACSSTAWSRPTRGSRSAASSARATGASWACSACASSSTSRRCGWRISRDRRRRRSPAGSAAAA